MSNFYNKDIIENAINGNKIFTKENQKEDFNKAFFHVFSLLKDAKNLYLSNSFSTSVFLSITAIEEVAKTEIGLYQYSKDADIEIKRTKDHLYNHKKKHIIALVGTVIMSQRLVDSLGEKRCKELLTMAHNGDFVDIREKALYCFRNNETFYIPSMVITKSLSKEILLLAIECLNDRLIGYTNFTMSIDTDVNDLFDSVIRN